MRTVKRIISILTVLAMMCALSVTAFAAVEKGTITVSDPGEYTYRAFKIFEVVEEDGEMTYTLPADSEWASDLISDGMSAFNGLTFTPDADPATVYTVTKGNTFSAADFAAFLLDKVDGKRGTAFNAGTSSAELDPGYYLVVSSDEGVDQPKAALATVLPGKNVNIQNKNDMPLDKTVDGAKEKGVQVGEELSFEIKSKVPDMTDENEEPYTTYIYLLSDKMDAGLTFNKDVTVTVGETAVVPTVITDPSAILTGNQIRYEPNANGNSFELSLDMVGKNTGDEVIISYTAVVNSDAAGTVTENNAVLEYGNDPKDLTIKDSQTKVYTARIIIDKFETGTPEQKLKGAEFRLYKMDGEDKLYYALGDNGVVSWTATEARAKVVTTDDDGSADFAGLQDGYYFLEEVKAPAGYTKMTEDKKITVDGSGATAVGLSADQIVQALTAVANVNNTPGTNMPSTGGIGTTIFYVISAILLMCGAYLAVSRRRIGRA